MTEEKQTQAEFYARQLFDALHSVREGQQEVVLDNFVAVLKEKGHIDLYPEIESLLLTYMKTQEIVAEGKEEIEKLNFLLSQEDQQKFGSDGILINVETRKNKKDEQN